MSPSNNERAEWAQDALDRFASRTGQDNSGCLENDTESVLGDLLSDLMHLCERDGMDFGACLITARGHFESEGGDCNALDDIATAEDKHDFDLLYHVRYWAGEVGDDLIETCAVTYPTDSVVPDMDGIREEADRIFGDMSLDPCKLNATIDGPFYLRNAVKSGPRASIRDDIVAAAELEAAGNVDAEAEAARIAKAQTDWENRQW